MRKLGEPNKSLMGVTMIVLKIACCLDFFYY